MGMFVTGLETVFQPSVLIMLVTGVLVGTIIGVLPGLSATMGVAILTPLTFGMDAVASLALLLGCYCASAWGGSITAIMANIPGTPSAIMTSLDGYPLGKKGQAGLAIGVATVSSFIGGVFSVFILAFLAGPIAEYALNFGAPEYFALAVFGLSVIAYISSKNMIKGVISACIGLLISTVGLDPMSGFARYTFKSYELLTGVELLPVMIGIFGLAEVLNVASKKSHEIILTKQMSRVRVNKKEFKEIAPSIARGSVIGTIIGAIPAAGGSIAAIISYGIEKAVSKKPEKFGTGALEGIAGSESANNASTGGAMIPLLTLGIPGDAITAVLIGSLMLHGISPGPMLFRNNMSLISSIYVLIFFANILFLFVGLGGARVAAKLISIPTKYFMPIVALLCCVGAYSLRNSSFDVFVLMALGVIGFLFNKMDVPTSPLILGLVLGSIGEINLRRAIVISRGDIGLIFQRPITMVVLALAILVLFVPTIIRLISNKNQKEKPENIDT